MNYVGIDIGSTASKVVVRGDNEMYFVLPTGWSSKETTNIIRERLRNPRRIALGGGDRGIKTVLGRIVERLRFASRRNGCFGGNFCVKIFVIFDCVFYI